MYYLEIFCREDPSPFIYSVIYIRVDSLVLYSLGYTPVSHYVVTQILLALAIRNSFILALVSF